jgi:hypothetical protein
LTTVDTRRPQSALPWRRVQPIHIAGEYPIVPPTASFHDPPQPHAHRLPRRISRIFSAARTTSAIVFSFGFLLVSLISISYVRVKESSRDITAGANDLLANSLA